MPQNGRRPFYALPVHCGGIFIKYLHPVHSGIGFYPLKDEQYGPPNVMKRPASWASISTPGQHAEIRFFSITCCISLFLLCGKAETWDLHHRRQWIKDVSRGTVRVLNNDYNSFVAHQIISAQAIAILLSDPRHLSAAGNHPRIFRKAGLTARLRNRPWPRLFPVQGRKGPDPVQFTVFFE